MVNVRVIEPEVWDPTLGGGIEKGGTEPMDRELTPALERDGPLGRIGRSEGRKAMTGDAMARDMTFERCLLARSPKIVRMALVTDTQAVSTVPKRSDPIMPMIEMTMFGSSDVAAVEAVFSDLPATGTPATGNGENLARDGKDSVLAAGIDSRIPVDDLDRRLARSRSTWTAMRGSISSFDSKIATASIRRS